MQYKEILPIKLTAEEHVLGGYGLPELTGSFYCCDVERWIADVAETYDGCIQTVYMDPPFMTGQAYNFQQKIGEKGWKGDRTSIIKHTAYSDVGLSGKEDLLSMMSCSLKAAHRMLSPEGSIYVHIDYRLSAHIRLMLDEIFGEDNFLNEIIWQYKSGGRSVKHFSRKHDTILFYRKSRRHYFNLDSVGVLRGKVRRNHMKQQIDEEGKVFWSIKSAGKEYKYFEDDKVYPGDVWNDISHLQQKDPERTGFDTQKPENLIERLIKVSSRPGDTVMDFFTGSGTVPAVAQKLGRNWIGVDSSMFSLHVSRKRLIDLHGSDNGLKLHFYYGVDGAVNKHARQFDIECNSLDDGYIAIKLNQYIAGDKAGQDEGLDAVDYWAVGYANDGMFMAVAVEVRTLKSAALSGILKMRADGNKEIAIHIVDVYGHQGFYRVNEICSNLDF